MSITRATKRPRHGKRRIDLSAVREALVDGRVHTILGLVVNGANGVHFEIDEEYGDILVNVETVPERMAMVAKLGSVAGGSGCGVYAIPAVGTEVAILVPHGELAYDAIIVATLGSGSVANPSGEGPTTTQTVIVNGTVLVHDGSGGTQPLVTKAEFDIHKHPTGVGPSGIPDNAPITGTTVLRAK